MSLIDLLAALEFEWPWAFLLLPLPLALLYRRSAETPARVAPQMPLYETAMELGIGETQGDVKPSRWKSIAMFLAWSLICVATMRPSYIGAQIDIPLSGRDLMIAVDISPSMEEVDMELNGSQATRLAVVKNVVSDFIAARAGDRVGLILFGSQPYVQSPLSFDTVTANTLLQEAYLGMAGQATAIGDAITLGVKRLRERPEQSRVLVLLSDGANTAGDIPPEKAAQLAQQANIKIYTIGIGADEMLKRSFFGSRKVNPSADLDEAMLTTIADVTDGQYFRARSTEELHNIYGLISALEPVEQEVRSYRPSKALYFWFLSLAVALFFSTLLVEQVIRLSKKLRFTQGANS